MECVLCYNPCSATPDLNRDLLPPPSVFHPSHPVSLFILPSLFLYLASPAVSSFTSFRVLILTACPHPSLFCQSHIIPLVSAPSLGMTTSRVVEVPYMALSGTVWSIVKIVQQNVKRKFLSSLIK